MSRWNYLIQIDAIHADANLLKLKGASKFLRWAWSKMAVASLVYGTLKLTVSKK